MRNKKGTKGFSLIEMLVYIAVIIFISTVVVVTYLSLDTVLLRNKTERELTQAASLAMERMVRDIRAGTDVDTAKRALPDELAIDRGVGSTTEFYLSDGRIYVDVNDVTLGPITNDNVTVTDLSFYHYESGSPELESEAVRIMVTLSAESRAASTTKTFYSTAVLRNSYE